MNYYELLTTLCLTIFRILTDINLKFQTLIKTKFNQ